MKYPMSELYSIHVALNMWVVAKWEYGSCRDIKHQYVNTETHLLTDPTVQMEFQPTDQFTEQC